jgi:hypothetical protein
MGSSLLFVTLPVKLSWAIEVKLIKNISINLIIKIFNLGIILIVSIYFTTPALPGSVFRV